MSVDGKEPLARFVLTRSHLNWEKRESPRLRPEAFMPHPRIVLSVFRTDKLADNSIWDLGRRVAEQRQKPLIARGDITCADVRQTGLDVVPAEPPARHADITGWPALQGSPKEDKARQKLLALKLVERAKLILAEGIRAEPE